MGCHLLGRRCHADTATLAFVFSPCVLFTCCMYSVHTAVGPVFQVDASGVRHGGAGSTVVWCAGNMDTRCGAPVLLGAKIHRMLAPNAIVQSGNSGWLFTITRPSILALAEQPGAAIELDRVRGIRRCLGAAFLQVFLVGKINVPKCSCLAYKTFIIQCLLQPAHFGFHFDVVYSILSTQR